MRSDNATKYTVHTITDGPSVWERKGQIEKQERTEDRSKTEDRREKRDSRERMKNQRHRIESISMIRRKVKETLNDRD